MNHDEMIKVLQADKEGRKIQYRANPYGWANCPLEWVNVCIKEGRFNFTEYEYRVKPEPLTLWVNVYDTASTAAYSTRKDAVNYSAGAIRTAVKMVEVE